MTDDSSSCLHLSLILSCTSSFHPLFFFFLNVLLSLPPLLSSISSIFSTLYCTNSLVSINQDSSGEPPYDTHLHGPVSNSPTGSAETGCSAVAKTFNLSFISWRQSIEVSLVSYFTMYYVLDCQLCVKRTWDMVLVSVTPWWADHAETLQ
jgi:hypothetical protein